MKRLGIVAAASALAVIGAMAGARAADAPDAALQAAVAAPVRAPANRARDDFRHPYEVLHFFGVKPSDAVVEILPGGGYWTEILAPYLRDHGKYYAAIAPADTKSAEMQHLNAVLKDKLAATPALYDKAATSDFDGDRYAIAPAGTADMVVTFRNLHNWLEAGNADAVLHAFFVALKPGGVLGVTDHRGRTDRPQDPMAKDGYVRQDFAVALIERAGFRLVGSSEVSANPRDTKDYPAGVWTLPPTYRLGERDHAKYQAIGEADEFTLKFVKPAK